MRLESISLHGFKSFAEKTTIKVFPGVTAIVGPNGAGKSNISEAVRWSLGEQSAKSLRGQRMEDLIFHGSASRKPLGLAEVELTFSNNGALAVPWSEVAVSRRLYRTGESEYLLNKTTTRLRDILDLFAGTGANPRAYSVMDQDKLNHVLTAKPHERRVFIEEAAGVARYKQQRTETEGKLDATRQNLTRVRDVMDEVKRQLGSLERQAKRAIQYKALQAERRELALAMLAADFAILTVAAERFAAELTALRDREHGLRAHVAQLGARAASQRAALQASDHRLGDLRQSVQKVQGELERLLERREQLGIQQRELVEESRRLDEELRVTRVRLGDLAGERESTRAALIEAQAMVQAHRRSSADLEAKLEHHRAVLTDARNRLEAQRHEQIRAASERTDLMRGAGELRERGVQLARRAERLAAELADAEEEAGRLAAQRGDVETARARAIARLVELGADRTRFGAELEEQARNLAAVEAELAESRVALAARSSSLDGLRQLERAREGYGAGVRAIFASAEAGGANGHHRPAGIVGTVADLLEVPPGLERAIEAALGERVQWVIVERFEHARAAVEYLQRRAGGSATFLPLEHLTDRPAPRPDENGVRWAARAVAAPAAGLVTHLLGQVAIVDDLDRAEALWRRNGVSAIYVTLDGKVLGPTGRLRGGAEDDAGAALEHSLLARKRQLRELENEVFRLTTAVDGAQTRVAAIGAEVAALRQSIARVDEEVQARGAERLTADKDLEQALREDERVRRHIETVRLETAQVARETDETAGTLEQLERRIHLAGQAEATHETSMLGLRAAIEEAQAVEGALLGELTAARVEGASATERAEALTRESARLDEMEIDLTERVDQAEARTTQLGDRVVWLAEERERTDGGARDAAGERDRIEVELRGAAEAHETLLAELSTIETETRRVESDLARVSASAHEVELRATEGRVRREELAQEARRSHGIEADALLAHHDAARDLDAVRVRHGELTEKLETIGAVNLVADEEYRELDERLTFLRTQHDDLMGSIKDLEKALRGMTRTAQERFAQAFDEINRHFSNIFERLFEGGRAELRLVEAEEGGDPLDTGVELMAQPRGKRLQAVTLMSGGERALTGLALLFAIFYFRPSPFCVLDEVDAPLDDANIHRFLRVLRELTSQTQFLVITHNRKTMEAADVLYGVTMEEPGLSKVVSVNLAAATAHAG
jgi:chromosome segregation protein